ncbi:MAG: hypothetical protein J3Q66DRAFT_365125 [Benniella sp.]|nr:MAG: hypothetical protein J3Q66DRAFT_365125 [Benniella sp.]
MVLRKRPAGTLTFGLVLASSLCAVVLLCSAEQQRKPQLQARAHPEQTIRINPNHAFYDSSEFSDDELAASAVSPFCKSFTFLCHIRCLQRGDTKDPGNTNELTSLKE